MSITRRDCYELKCDGCGEDCCGEDWEGDYIPHHASKFDALEYLEYHGGEEVEGKHLCEDCMFKREQAASPESREPEPKKEKD